MIKTFKIISALLSYPTEELKKMAPAFPALLREEGLVPAPALEGLEELIRDIAERELMDAQERYVLLFDRTRSLSLHLFEHVHGESRDRGQAMVDLGKLYSEHGLEVSVSELPDFLPMFLEFLAQLPAEEAWDMLGQPAHVIAALGQRLAKRNSPYRFAFTALLSLVTESVEETAIEALLEQYDDDPNDLTALDKEWQETAVTFGPDAGNATCAKITGMVDRLNAHRSNANG